jgi:hypothetical protein
MDKPLRGLAKQAYYEPLSICGMISQMEDLVLTSGPSVVFRSNKDPSVIFIVYM